jgi:hypothetical protein
MGIFTPTTGAVMMVLGQGLRIVSLILVGIAYGLWG